MRAMTRRDVWLTVCTWVLVPAFGALCYWQVTRALGGNDLSWAYVFEWPIFAGYLVHVWWKLIHEDTPPATPAGADPGAGDGHEATAPAPDEEEDEELAAYNRYLAALEESGRRKRW
jgi:hypothetical protein